MKRVKMTFANCFKLLTTPRKQLISHICRTLSCSSSNNNLITKPSLIKLEHRNVLKLSGKDTLDFLQGLVTNDVFQLQAKQRMFAMMLDTRGRIMHDFMMYWLSENQETAVLLECEGKSQDKVMKSLKMYKLRKDVAISHAADISVWQLVAPPETELGSLGFPTDQVVCKDPRSSTMGWRIITDRPKVELTTDDVDIYHDHRLKMGIPEGVIDLPPGKCSPLESNIDLLNGISFDKGCYLGQELTARTYHTGVIRKRLLPFTTQSDLRFVENEKIYNEDGKVTGKIRSSNGKGQGLALMKLDCLEMKHFCSDRYVEIFPYRPDWWPKHLDR